MILEELELEEGLLDLVDICVIPSVHNIVDNNTKGPLVPRSYVLGLAYSVSAHHARSSHKSSTQVVPDTAATVRKL